MDARDRASAVADVTVFGVVLVAAGAVIAMVRTCVGLSARGPIGPMPDRPARRAGIAERLGGRVRQGLRRCPDRDRDRAVGRALMFLTAFSLVAPLVGIVVGVMVYVVGVLQLSNSARNRNEEIASGLAEVVDLCALMLRSGHNVAAAIDEVGRWIDGPVGENFEWCSQQVSHGRPIGDTLEELPARLGAVVRPLVSALLAHEQYGAPITTGLAQLSADHRAERRRIAEAAARRLPVHLLAPLITCVLPAFLLLTVLPVVAETFASLDVLAP